MPGCRVARGHLCTAARGARSRRALIGVVLSCLLSGAVWAEAPGAATGDAGPPFGRLRVVHEIDCAKPNADVPFVEYPQGVSRVETILGRACRVLPNDAGEAKYFAYRVGAKRGLRAGACYLLDVEFPDEKPRSLFLCNWGCETARGVHTGSAVGDCLKGKYVNHNPESLRVPQSGKFLRWRQVFFLHDRFPGIQRPRGRQVRPLVPEDGFWVIVAQPRAVNAPKSAGAAVAAIRLFEVGDLSRYDAAIRYPPAGLPRRHLFWREEMADGVIAMGHKPEEKDETLRGVREPIDWYEHKARLMRFLGMNTYCKDLLEFGHNQGWDSGGSAWYNASPTPQRWRRILEMLSKYGFDVLAYYEYAGSIGQDASRAIGSQRRCRTLAGGKDYTHIRWVHKTNADLADPDFLADAKKLLAATIVRHKLKVRFLGAWFRPRPEANPISFSDANLKRFAAEARPGGDVTRARLQADKALLERYYAWWFRKRRDFNVALCRYLREQVGPQAVVLYTCDASEPGISLPRTLTGAGQKDSWKWKTAVVNDNPAAWARILDPEKDRHYFMVKPVAYDRVVRENMHLRALLAPRETWSKWEWHHATPWADPHNYTDADGVLLTCTFHRLYTVSSPAAFEAFRGRSGLAVVRHYALNENEMRVGKDDPLGYFVADVERAGPYSMISEARAVAWGDPRFIGYLVGNSFSRGFPEYARRFNAALLSLPALPSRIVAGAASDAEVVVRSIPTAKHGTWVAIVNTGLSDKTGVTVALPARGKVTNAATGAAVSAPGSKLTLSLYPGQLVSLRVR